MRPPPALLRRLLAAQFPRFCVIGGVGFVVDAAVLMLVIRLAHADPVAARFVSFPVAVLVTFELNRRWTFAARPAGPYLATLAGYVGVQGVGFACNLAIYAAADLLLRPAAAAPLLALAAASALALLINYLGARAIVFRDRPARSGSAI